MFKFYVRIRSKFVTLTLDSTSTGRPRDDFLNAAFAFGYARGVHGDGNVLVLYHGLIGLEAQKEANQTS